MSFNVRVEDLRGVRDELRLIRQALDQLVIALTVPPTDAEVPDSIGDQLIAARNDLSTAADTLDAAVDTNKST